MQNGTFNQCSGILYDSGGAAGNYANNENFVLTLCPENAGDAMHLEFTVFNTQLNADILYIYDGADNSDSPLIGSYSGTNSPGVVEATNASGCLTLEWISNGAANTNGFEAIIGCATPCQTISASIDSTNPPPESTGVININLGDTVDFTGSATFSDDGTGATYIWVFGDGNVANGQNVSNTFNAVGSFVVQFTVSDTNPTGCSDTVTIQVNVLGPYIQVDQSIYTVDELVEDVLINSPCASVSNINFSTGTNFGSSNGIGYFISDGNNFPYQEGIVLTTGNAANANGPESGTLSDGTFSWPGDLDLEAFIPGLVSNNATFIEFDFVPLANTISFNFLFASDEYGTFQCTFADGFAFLLTDTTTGVTTNLAVVPGTSDPVSVLTIRDQLYNAGCPSVNAQYFGAYYGTPNGLPEANSPTDFRGHTVSLQASAVVTPNITYTIKLVLADHNDTAYDSAVFLEAGSFDLGGDLGEDVTVASGNAVCYGQQITLDTQVPNATHTWYFNGTEIPGETESTLDVLEPGEYTADVIFSGACQSSDSIIIEFIPNPVVDGIQNLNSCGNTSVAIFNLTENDVNVLGSQNPADFLISYFETQVDADNNVNPIPDPINYSGTDGQTIFVRINDVHTGSCFETSSFALSVSQPIINSVPNLEVCDDVTNDGFASFDLESQTLGILGTQPAVDFSVTYYTSLADANGSINPIVSPYTNTINPEPIFVRVEAIGDPTCFSVSPAPVFDLVVLVSDDPSFTVSPSCDGGISTVTGTVGGIFSFNPLPGDGAVIDAATGTVTGGTPEATYTIEYTTTGVCPQTSQQVLTVLALDDSSFTMTPTCDGGTATITGLPGGTFAFSAPLPTDGAVIDPVTGLVSGGSSDTSYTVAYTTSGACPDTTILTFTSYPLPVAVSPTPLEVCDDGVPDGLTAIDLSIKNTEISGGDPNLQVTYYLTQADADSEMNALPIPYTNISNPQTVYVRVEDINTSCYVTTTLDLIVEQAPIATVPTPLEFCDPDSDGFGEFMLTDTENEITGGDPNLTVSYHETMADADNNVNPQSSPYNNIVAYNQVIYVRVESSTIATDCATIVELQLIVYDTPDITDPPTPLEVCDDDTDGFAQFDLTSKDTEILNGLDPIQYSVTYYETQANADAPMNPILNTTSYTNITANLQTLWVRVEDTLTGCYSITTLDLVVNALPVLVQPTPLSLCDYDNPGDEVEAFTLEDKVDEILNGQTGITITFHETQVGADTNTAQIFSPYTNIANAQTIYVRAENDVTGCVSTITLDLRVEPLPSPATPTPLEVCDDDNDGFALFDLDSKTMEILNGEPDVTITYHETMADADSGVNPLASPYANIVEDTQTIYVRAENDLTGCYRVVMLELVVFPSPEVPLDIADYIVCDDDNDGFAQFDLTSMDGTILGSQLPADFILTYHVNQGDADTGNNPIINVMSYTNLSNPQTIYVRLESVVNACVTTGEFDLVVALPPVPVQPTPLEVCDDDYYTDMDGIAVFDLTVKDNEITGGNASWAVTYYETDADAQSDTNAIDPADAYQNITNAQTLYVRVTDGDTGCYAFTTLTIRVEPNPTPQVPLPIELCDDVNTGDGVETFDLTIREPSIINGEGGVTASYHETLADAESGMNAIVDPTMYINTGSPQIIYVRVTNGDDPMGTNGSGCYTIVELELIVHPLPDVIAVTDLIECEVNTDGFFDFDLESKTSEVLNGQDPAIFAVTYHETLADAQSGMNALVSPYTNLVNPQQIFVNITNTTTGCDISTVSFNIEVQEGAVANMPLNEYVICDNVGDNDGIGQFDLSTQDAEILGVTQTAGYTVSYYTTIDDAQAGVNAIPTLYENLSNPQVIYARVDNDATICYDITTLTLRVDLLPIFDIEDSYIICVNTNGTETIETPPVIDTGLDIADYSFEWTDSSNTVLGTDSSFVPSQAGVYQVLVTNMATGCQSTDSTTVVQSSPPEVVATVTTLAFAEEHIIEATATGDGEYEFSLDGGPWQSSGTFTDVMAGDHVVTARDLNGCGQASDMVMIMDYPLYFTPNDDGYHDTWNIIGISSQVDAKIYIFDRYGKLLKQLSPTGAGWNGTFNGAPMPSDDYWFTVEYREPSDGTQKQFRAHFTLKR